MRQLLWNRAKWFVATVWIVLTASFFLMRAAPGGPFSSDRALDPAAEVELRAYYNLDWPLWRQYLDYLGPFNWDSHGLFGDRTRIFGGVLTGDLGPSFRYLDYSVNDIIAQSLPISAQLGCLALLWAVLFGALAGVLSALRPGSKLDMGLRLAATIGIAVPNFVLAGLLILLFSFSMQLAPVAGWGTLSQAWLPSLALGAPLAAYIARLTRTGMLEVLSQEYVRTAAAKGLPRRTIVMRHALRGGLLPVIAYLGPATAGVLTGSLVIEKIFFIPGMGTHFVNSALNRDYTLAMGVTLLYTVLVYTLNLAVDVAYCIIDPRVRAREAA